MGESSGTAMNVKISEDSVTFKISEEELKSLLSGKALEKKMMLGRGIFVVVIDPEPEPFFDDATQHPLKLIQDRFETCLMFCTSKEIIQKLFDMGKSRDGLACRADGMNVFLQVDVRGDSRERNADGQKRQMQ
jgi:hypothetical protein